MVATQATLSFFLSKSTAGTKQAAEGGGVGRGGDSPAGGEGTAPREDERSRDPEAPRQPHEPKAPPEATTDDLEEELRPRGRVRAGPEVATAAGKGEPYRGSGNLCRALAGLQAAGSLAGAAQEVANRISQDAYCLLSSMPFADVRLQAQHANPWAPSAPLRASQQSLRCGHISAIEFDCHGELVASVSTCGRLRVHDFLSLRWASQVSAEGTADQAAIVKVDTGRKLAALRWSKSDENTVACAAFDDRLVGLYDLQYCGSKPTTTVEFKAAAGVGWAHSNLGRRSAIGLTDLQFLPACGGSRYSLAASGPSGCVALWDLRAGKSQVATLSAPPKSGGLQALQIIDGGQVAVAGTDAGEVMAWDLRGGSSSGHQFGAAGAYTHSMLFSFPLDIHMRTLSNSGLKDHHQLRIQAVSCLSSDPRDTCRMAFALSSGWYGVFDSRLQRVTHCLDVLGHRRDIPMDSIGADLVSGAENAAAPTTAAQGAADPTGTRRRAARQRGCWVGNGATFAIGSSQATDLLMIDFSRGPLSATAAEAVGLPVPLQSRPVLHLPLADSSALCVSANPTSEELLVGTDQGSLILARQQPPAGLTGETQISETERTEKANNRS